MPEYVILSRKDQGPWVLEDPIFPDHPSAEVWYARNTAWFSAHHQDVEFRIRRLIDPIEQEAQREVFTTLLNKADAWAAHLMELDEIPATDLEVLHKASDILND